MEKKEIRENIIKKPDVSGAKANMRRDYLKKRNDIPKEERERESGKIQALIESLRQYRECAWLFCYVSYKSEVETKGLLYRALKHGKKVAVPKVLDKEGHMEFYQIDSMEDLISGYHGILAPDSHRCKQVTPQGKQVLMLLPGAVFDKSGGRIGYGGGYYDRYLNTYGKTCKTLVKIALAFECQVGEELATEPFDVKVDGIVTEKGVYDFKL